MCDIDDQYIMYVLASKDIHDVYFNPNLPRYQDMKLILKAQLNDTLNLELVKYETRYE